MILCFTDVLKRIISLKKSTHLSGTIIVITVCSVFLWLPLFMNYYGLMEADLLTATLSFENSDLDILPAVQKSQLLFWNSGIVFNQWMDDLFKASWVFHNQVPAIENKNITLRC